MNKSKSFYVTVLGLLLAPLFADAENVTVSVSNNTGMQRQELVEVSVDDVYTRLGIQKGGQFIVKNALGPRNAGIAMSLSHTTNAKTNLSATIADIPYHCPIFAPLAGSLRLKSSDMAQNV